jgi:hypothetical protein
VVTPKKTGKLTAQMEANKWKKGQSGNPSGRPKKKPLTEALEALMAEPYPVDFLPLSERERLGLKEGGHYTFAEVTARYLILGVQTGKGGVGTCFKEVAERLEGKVMQPVELTSIRDGLDELTEEQLLQYIETGEMPVGPVGRA